MEVVEAAGGLVWQRVHGHVEVALVHRPLRDDWTLPVGRLEPGEDTRACAVREVAEESGYTCELGALLTVLEFRGEDDNVIHRFHIFEMRALAGEFTDNPETDAVAWLTPEDAVAQATYDNVRALLARAPTLLSR